MARLHDVTTANKAAGRKSLVVYLTGGLPDVATTTRLIEACAVAGADAVELGVPFSDPIMDGPVIQAASQKALDAGVTPPQVLDAASPVADLLPVGFMTYANVVHHAGYDRFAGDAARAGLCAAIVPDLPLEEVDPWADAAADAGLDAVLFVAPTTPDDRIVAIARRTRGFLYAVGVLGVTGVREQLASSAVELAERVERLTAEAEVAGDVPVLVGVGVGTPDQAVEAAAHADGVIIGSAVVQRVLDAPDADAAVESVAAFVRSVRDALDAAYPGTAD